MIISLFGPPASRAPTHKKTRTCIFSHSATGTVHREFCTSSSVFFFPRPSFHTPRPDRRPTDRPSVRPFTAPVVTTTTARARLARSLARSMPTHTALPHARAASRLALALAHARSSFALAPPPPHRSPRPLPRCEKQRWTRAIGGREG